MYCLQNFDEVEFNQVKVAPWNGNCMLFKRLETADDKAQKKRKKKCTKWNYGYLKQYQEEWLCEYLENKKSM